MLLVEKKNAYGLNKITGDFVLTKNNKILRFTKGDKIIFYSGLQILNVNILKSFNLDKFSFNIVWLNSINKIKTGPNIFLANEFFDALPIKQFKKKKK